MHPEEVTGAQVALDWVQRPWHPIGQPHEAP
jgi:hypothetical protein